MPFQKKIADKIMHIKALNKISRNASGYRLKASNSMCQTIEGMSVSKKINRTVVP
jgi:hypothetical protein